MVDDRLWKIMKKRLRYSDEEAERFRNNPRNEEVIAKADELFNTRFKVTVVESHGCNSRHKVGDTFYLDGHGNLLKEHCPEKLCIFALSSLSTLVFTVQELIYAGVNPNQMRFKRVNCIDVGLNCGGWGRVVLELTAEKKENG